ncbi:MAG: PP0621 family protein [Pseudomonadota bacterium]
MNVIRLALILLAGWIIWRLLSARLERGRRNRELKRQHGEQQRIRPEATVQCAHCGLYVPENRAFKANGHHYCSAEHRDADTG